MNLLTSAKSLTEWMIAVRRQLHQYPELSHHEQKTKAFIEEQLTSLGIVTKSYTGKDIVGILQGRLPGKTIVVRADMDALPILEETGLPFSSKIKGVMHACGHDGHMAIVLGLAKKLTEEKADFKGTVVFLFQHAEESVPGGARELVEAGVLDDVDMVVGGHLWQPLPKGLLGIRKGSLMAGASQFEIKINGHGGHGSMPHTAVDPIYMASQLIGQAYAMINRQFSPEERAVLSFGTIQSGTNYNIIPNEATIGGTVRYFDEAVMRSIEEKLNILLQSITTAYGGSYELTFIKGDPPVVNDAALVDVMKQEAQTIKGISDIVDIEPIYAGEDFSHYAQTVPSVYFLLGMGGDYNHHHPKFDIDESMLKTGCDLMEQTILRLLEGWT